MHTVPTVQWEPMTWLVVTGGSLGDYWVKRVGKLKWLQNLEGIPKQIPHRWHFSFEHNAYSEPPKIFLYIN